jgi:predicted nicotinamide N-methyase
LSKLAVLPQQLMSVVQASEDELGLSPETLAALAAFAAESDLSIDFTAADVRQQVQSAMDTHEKEEKFDFTFGSSSADEVTIRLQGVSSALGQTLASTGLTVWLAARQLAEYLWQVRASLAGQRIVELGSGLGLCGLLCSKLCGASGSVVLTDGGEEFTPAAQTVLQQQVQRNSSTGTAPCTVQVLTWGEHEQFIEQHSTIPFNLVIAADVLYEAEAVAPFLDTVAALLQLQPHARLLLGYAHRNVSIDTVWAVAADKGLVWSVVPDFTPEVSAVQIFEVRLAAH